MLLFLLNFLSNLFFSTYTYAINRYHSVEGKLSSKCKTMTIEWKETSLWYYFYLRCKNKCIKSPNTRCLMKGDQISLSCITLHLIQRAGLEQCAHHCEMFIYLYKIQVCLCFCLSFCVSVCLLPFFSQTDCPIALKFGM